jgi:hypothetical protein
MTESFTMSAEATSYMDALRSELSDLPADERDDLLEDVGSSLIEADGEGPIVARLGTPGRFAAELRSAAGLRVPEAGSVSPEAPSPGALATLLAVGRRVAASPRAVNGRRTLRELAPIWWLVRAYVAAGALVLLFDDGWSVRHPEIPRLGGGAAGVVELIVIGAGSIWLGLRARRHAPLGALAAGALALLNTALVVAAIPIVRHVARNGAATSIVVVQAPPSPAPGLLDNGLPVQNIYPFTRSGKPLYDVLLYDAFGVPLNVGRGALDPNRRVLQGADGTGLFNSFPIRYFEPDTHHVAHPSAGPSVTVPHIVTPRLTHR